MEIFAKKVINLHYYTQFDDFKVAVMKFFENIQQHKEEFRTLMTPNFQRFSGAPKAGHRFS